MSFAPSDPLGWQLEVVRCPISGERLSPADETLVEQLQQRALSGKLYSRAGESVSPPIIGGLVNESKQLYYRIIEGVLLLSADEAIELGASQSPAARPTQ